MYTFMLCMENSQYTEVDLNDIIWMLAKYDNSIDVIRGKLICAAFSVLASRGFKPICDTHFTYRMNSLVFMAVSLSLSLP